MTARGRHRRFGACAPHHGRADPAPESGEPGEPGRQPRQGGCRRPHARAAWRADGAARGTL